MTLRNRLRRHLVAALTAVIPLAFAACVPNSDYPNTTFTPHSEVGLAIDQLWDSLLLYGLIVFVVVEGALIYIVIRYRHREGQPEPKHIHGNTAIEILWTVIPAVILVLIAIPTVQTIFRTQGAAPAGSLQVTVIGHQWWWEFRYPELGVTTANELYLPVGRTVNFTLTTEDVLHSFWIPQLGGKRDLITNKTNHLWFTPDSSMGPNAWNGFCAEYCGTSHGNMRFRAFTVPPADFDAWVAHQKSPAVGSQPAAPAAPPAAVAAAPGRAAGQSVAATPAPPPPQVTPVTTASYEFPRSQLPAYTIPTTPIPSNIPFTDGLTGDATRGRQVFSVTCIGCHAVNGLPGAVALLGPNLTHVASRTTIGAGLFPNDERLLRLWVKNSQIMKEGSKMPPQGKGFTDFRFRTPGTLEDQQIADVVAYLLTLK